MPQPLNLSRAIVTDDRALSKYDAQWVVDSLGAHNVEILDQSTLTDTAIDMIADGMGWDSTDLDLPWQWLRSHAYDVAHRANRLARFQ